MDLSGAARDSALLDGVGAIAVVLDLVRVDLGALATLVAALDDEVALALDDDGDGTVGAAAGLLVPGDLRSRDGGTTGGLRDLGLDDADRVAVAVALLNEHGARLVRQGLDVDVARLVRLRVLNQVVATNHGEGVALARVHLGLDVTVQDAALLAEGELAALAGDLDVVAVDNLTLLVGLYNNHVVAGGAFLRGEDPLAVLLGDVNELFALDHLVGVLVADGHGEVTQLGDLEGALAVRAVAGTITGDRGDVQDVAFLGAVRLGELDDGLALGALDRVDGDLVAVLGDLDQVLALNNLVGGALRRGELQLGTVGDLVVVLARSDRGDVENPALDRQVAGVAQLDDNLPLSVRLEVGRVLAVLVVGQGVEQVLAGDHDQALQVGITGDVDLGSRLDVLLTLLDLARLHRDGVADHDLVAKALLNHDLALEARLRHDTGDLLAVLLHHRGGDVVSTLRDHNLVVLGTLGDLYGLAVLDLTLDLLGLHLGAVARDDGVDANQDALAVDNLVEVGNDDALAGGLDLVGVTGQLDGVALDGLAVDGGYVLALLELQLVLAVGGVELSSLVGVRLNVCGLDVDEHVGALADVQGELVVVALLVLGGDDHLARLVSLRGQDPVAVFVLLQGLDDVFALYNLRLAGNVVQLEDVVVGVTNHSVLVVLAVRSDVDDVVVLVARSLARLVNRDLSGSAEDTIVGLDGDLAVLLAGGDVVTTLGDLPLPALRDRDGLGVAGDGDVEIVVVHHNVGGLDLLFGLVDHVDGVLVAVALTIDDDDAHIALALLDRGDVQALAVLGLGHLDQAVRVVDKVDLPVGQLLHRDDAGVLLLGEVEGVLVGAEEALDLDGLLARLVRLVLHRRGCGDGGRLGGDGLGRGRRRAGLRLGDVLWLSRDGCNLGLRVAGCRCGGRGLLGHGLHHRGALAHGDGALRQRGGLGDSLGVLALNLGHRGPRGDVLGLGAGRLDRLGHLGLRLLPLGDGGGRGDGLACGLGDRLLSNRLGVGVARDGLGLGHNLRGLGNGGGLHRHIRALRVRVVANQARLTDGDEALGRAFLTKLVADVVVARDQNGDVLAVLDLAGRFLEGVALAQDVLGLAGNRAALLAHLKAGPLCELLLGDLGEAAGGLLVVTVDVAALQVQRLLVVGQECLQGEVQLGGLLHVALVKRVKHALGAGDGGALNIRVDLQVAALLTVVAVQAGNAVELAHHVGRILLRSGLRKVDAPAGAEVVGVQQVRLIKRTLLVADVGVELHSCLLLICRKLGILARNSNVCVRGRGSNDSSTSDDGGGDKRGHDALLKMCVLQRLNP
ncbi:hypothetical protein COGO111638_12540 [Corynebacterium gottingense]